MRLITMIAASILSMSLALGVASNGGQKPAPKPIDPPQIQMLPEGRMPDMTKMPDSQLQAAFLLNQGGQSIVVDTAGKPLAPRHHRETPRLPAPVIHVTSNIRS